MGTAPSIVAASPPIQCRHPQPAPVHAPPRGRCLRRTISRG